MRKYIYVAACKLASFELKNAFLFEIRLQWKRVRGANLSCGGRLAYHNTTIFRQSQWNHKNTK